MKKNYVTTAYLAGGLCLAMSGVGMLLAEHAVIQFAICASLAVLLCGGSLTDLRWRILPNCLTYTFAGVGLLCHAMASATGTTGGIVVGVASSFAGMATCFLATLALHAAGKLGAGDVKMAAAMGALLGPVAGVNAVFWTFLLGAAFVLAFKVSQLQFALFRRLLETQLDVAMAGDGRRGAAARVWSSTQERGLPMGVFLALGTLANFFVGPLL